MANTANKAQKYLLDNNCGDLILNDHRTTKPEDRIYASDIMMMFLESERGQNVDTGESNCTIFDVIKSVCSCGRCEINVLSGICDICWNEKFPDEQTVL